MKTHWNQKLKLTLSILILVGTLWLFRNDFHGMIDRDWGQLAALLLLAWVQITGYTQRKQPLANPLNVLESEEYKQLEQQNQNLKYVLAQGQLKSKQHEEILDQIQNQLVSINTKPKPEIILQVYQLCRMISDYRKQSQNDCGSIHGVDINAELHHKLKLKYPDLSNQLCKVCLLIHKGYDNKQMTDILCVQAGSIYKYKTQIKHILNIKSDEKLDVKITEMIEQL